MLPRSCREIMEDVLERFDPRPETGIFINSELSFANNFVKTIPTPAELSVLLKYVYRQACIDSINNWHRTPLHLACDANKVNSHEKIIMCLIDKYGCNVNLKDMHGRKALDLLIQDKTIREMPTATKAREDIFNNKRQEKLDDFYNQFKETERLKIERRHQEILQSCINREVIMDERIWHCLRGGAAFIKRYFDTWEVYNDPDTGNYFYCKMPEKPKEGEIKYQKQVYTNYSWEIPPEIKNIVDRTEALLYLMRKQSFLLRTFENWEVYREKKTDIEYYYNVQTKKLRFSLPTCMNLRKIVRYSTKTGELLGYAREWEVRLDKCGNKFYRNKITRAVEYIQPLDAIQVKAVERLCTGYQFKNQELTQKWFSCEQCNRAWKTLTAEKMMMKASEANDNATQVSVKSSASNKNKTGKPGPSTDVVATKSLIVCEPCVARCHDRHKGVRFLYEAPSSRTLQCMCMDVSKITGMVCHGTTISKGQLRTQELARNKRIDNERQHKRNKKSPPIFAYVPRYDRSGKEKVYSGWHLCRSCIPKKSTPGADDASTAANELLLDEKEDDKFSKGETNEMESSSDSDSDDEDDDEDATDAEDVDGNNPAATKDGNQSVGGRDGDGASQQGKQQQLVPYRKPLIVNKKKNKDSDSLSTYISMESVEIDDDGKVQIGFAHDLILPIYLLNKSWLEIYDVDEPETLRYGDQVLCTRFLQPWPKLTGRVKSIVKPGFYQIRLDDRVMGDEIFERSQLELTSRPRFFFNVFTGESTWIKDDIMPRKKDGGIAGSEEASEIGAGEVSELNSEGEEEGNAIPPVPGTPSAPGAVSTRALLPPIPPKPASFQSSQSLQISGPDWLQFYEEAEMRRSFDEIDEMYHTALNMIFYVNFTIYKEELSALRLQKIFRQKKCQSNRHVPWKSFAFSFDTPDKVRHLKKVKAGWAYLRRRADSVGDFRDEDGMEWEEYIDKLSSEYFYWQEDENLFSWIKPNVFQRKKDPVNKYSENEEVLYRFPGRRTEEPAIILKVRFDDETGEDKYDLVHKYNAELKYKWIPRIQIKPMPLEGDALLLAKMEMKWKNVIRRRREAEERKKQRDKEMKIQEELQRLEAMNSMAYKLIGDKALNEDGGGISQHTRMMRARNERIRLEETIRREEIDATEGKARRDKIQILVDEMKASLGKRLSRADVLNITRSIEMKFLMNERIEKRNKLQIELAQVKKEKEERTEWMEHALQEREVQMTTPRSLNRRKIIRRVHMAMKRQKEQLIICEWGCGDWFHVGYEQQDHQLRRCVKRILPCALGCDVKNTEEQWLSPYVDPNASTTIGDGLFAAAAASAPSSPSGSPNGSNYSPNSSFSNPPSPIGSASVQKRKTMKSRQSIRDLTKSLKRAHSSTFSRDSLEQLLVDENAEKNLIGTVTVQQHHETHECPKRLVMCPLQCLEWICAEVLDHHMKELCTKRPAKPLPCRLGCNALFGGKIETLIEAEDERLQHEQEECDYRIVRCNWCFDDGRVCAAQMKAIERTEHRDYHLSALGILNYSVPGTYVYKVPKNISRMKIQMWGAGGGSGYFYGRQGGHGGGGAFIEAIIDLEPFTVLEIVVGSGGKAGARGTEVEIMELNEMKRFVREAKEAEKNLPREQRSDRVLPQMEVIDAQCGVTLGGSPGGGEGYGGGGCWACGGGGGYTAISKRTTRGTFTLLVAAGGGGGGSVPGAPGGGLEGVLPGTLLDPICGGTATVEKGGLAGDSGSTYNAAWPAQAGQQWQGGNGCEFGAGGGGGYFGGGGGGTTPGIAGGGGGGSSFLYTNTLRDHLVIMGHGMHPGGLQHNPPQACGIGEWDKMEGYAGQGGRGDPLLSFPGNNGAVRLLKPGFY